MRQLDANEFVKEMELEIQAHKDNNHWEVITKDAIPHGTSILPTIWSVKRKRRIDAHSIYKWKARFTIHEGLQEYEINYGRLFLQWSDGLPFV
jgi:hypothetical protein